MSTSPFPQAPITPAQLVAEYIVLRDQKKAADEQYKAFIEQHYTNRMNELELLLLDFLNTSGADSIASPDGTAYKKLDTSVTVSDAAAFRRHVIGTEAWELIDWRANKTAVKDLLEGGDGLPPGVNYSSAYSVGIRRK
jgi:hypothetical protein